MKQLKDQINEGIVATIIGYLCYIVIGFIGSLLVGVAGYTIHQAYQASKKNGNKFFDKFLDGVSYMGYQSDLKTYIAHNGVIFGFIGWLMKKIEDHRYNDKTQTIFTVANKLAQNPEFIKWAKGKRTLKELKDLVPSIISSKDTEYATKAIKYLWDEYKNPLNITQSDLQKEVSKL